MSTLPVTPELGTPYFDPKDIQRAIVVEPVATIEPVAPVEIGRASCRERV